jgi:hypothetical protein
MGYSPNWRDWKNVAAPALGNPQDSINAAARLIGGATNGMSGALTNFGDQQALQQLAQFSDARKLQEAIQSGAMPLNNASSEALSTIMERPTNLIRNQGTQASLDHLANFTRPNEVTDRTRSDAAWGRTDIARQLTDVAQTDINTRLTNGSLNTINQARDLLKSVSSGPKEVTQFYTKALSDRFPELLAVPVAPPIASVIGSFGSNISVPGVTNTSGNVAAPVVASTGGNSVGERNNNQGNLMGSGWITKMPGYLGNDEKGFAKFSTNEQGNAANTHQLERYWEGTQATGGKPVRTIDGIISTWAPQETATSKTGNSAESVANYKKYVQARTGIDATKELTKEQLGAVRLAMQEFETGNKLTNLNISQQQPTNVVGTPTTVAAPAAIENIPNTQQLSNSAASSAALNSMAVQGTNYPEVVRWLGATATSGNGASTDVANELKKTSLPNIPLERIQEMLHQVATGTKTTGDYRTAGEILKSSVTGDKKLNIFGVGPLGWQNDFNESLIAENIKKYNTRSKTADSIQAGRSIEQGTAVLAETQKQVEALKVYRDAKKAELAKGVFGVTPDDVLQADKALQDALKTGVQIQKQVETFRPKTAQEIDAANKPPLPVSDRVNELLASENSGSVPTRGSMFDLTPPSNNQKEAEAVRLFKAAKAKAEQAGTEQEASELLRKATSDLEERLQKIRKAQARS